MRSESKVPPLIVGRWCFVASAMDVIVGKVKVEEREREMKVQMVLLLVERRRESLVV